MSLVFEKLKDTAIKTMRFESRTSIVAEVNQESQRSFEYEIDF